MNHNLKLTEPPELASHISTLAEKWETEVEGISSTARMSEHPAYQEIIQMGTKIVPLLLQELKRNPRLLAIGIRGNNRRKSHRARTTRPN